MNGMYTLRHPQQLNQNPYHQVQHPVHRHPLVMLPSHPKDMLPVQMKDTAYSISTPSTVAGTPYGSYGCSGVTSGGSVAWTPQSSPVQSLVSPRLSGRDSPAVHPARRYSFGFNGGNSAPQAQPQPQAASSLVAPASKHHVEQWHDTSALKDVTSDSTTLGDAVLVYHPVRKAVARAWLSMGKVRGSAELAAVAQAIVAGGYSTRASLRHMTDEVADQLEIPIDLARALRNDGSGAPAWQKSGPLPPAPQPEQLNLFASSAASITASAGHPSIKDTASQKSLRGRGGRGEAIGMAPLNGGFPCKLRDYTPTSTPRASASVVVRALSPQLASREQQLASPRGVSCFTEEEENTFVPSPAFRARSCDRISRVRSASPAETRAHVQHVKRQLSARSLKRESSFDGVGERFRRISDPWMASSSNQRTSSFSFPKAGGRHVAGMDLPRRAMEQSRDVAPTFISEVHLVHKPRSPRSRAQSADKCSTRKLLTLADCPRKVSFEETQDDGGSCGHMSMVSGVMVAAESSSELWRSESQVSAVTKVGLGRQANGEMKQESREDVGSFDTDADDLAAARKEYAERLVKAVESTQQIGRMLNMARNSAPARNQLYNGVV